MNPVIQQQRPNDLAGLVWAHVRRGAGMRVYGGGFVFHYIGPLVYPRGMPRQLELVAGFSILAWNTLVYDGVFLLPLYRTHGG